MNSRSEEKNTRPPIYELGPDFYDEVSPALFPERIIRFQNKEYAQKIGLGKLSDPEWIEHFSNFKTFPHNITQPLALRYHGHQFGVYNPDLGDGRGFLLAQFQSSKLLDLGTKGSGQTPYSRGGDGRLTLKGAFREALCSEYLESLGVNTSKTFSIIETGEELIRHDEPSPTRSAVLVRLSHSHIRIGSFQRLAYLNQAQNIRKLTEYCLKHLYPELTGLTEAERIANFYQAVLVRVCDLVASYMMTGFVHGVLNTDNINITGESFDYGPYRFLPTYDPQFTAAYFDRSGFYSFGRQPMAVLWNLEQLGKSLALAYPDLPVTEILESFADHFNDSAMRIFQKRLNIKVESTERLEEIMSAFFHFMDRVKPAFEQMFFDLYGGWNLERLQHSPYFTEYKADTTLQRAFAKAQLDDETKMSHPYFSRQKPETLLIDEIERIWDAIRFDDDWKAFYAKINSIREFRGLY